MANQDKPAHSPLTKEESEAIGIGSIEISEEVIAAIASQAASKIDGIRVVGSSSRWTDILGGKESTRRGVTVKSSERSGHVEVDLDVVVVYGVGIYDAAHQLQLLIKSEIESMTGTMSVDKVNVRVKQLVLPEQLPPDPISPDRVVEEGIDYTEEEELGGEEEEEEKA